MLKKFSPEAMSAARGSSEPMKIFREWSQGKITTMEYIQRTLSFYEQCERSVNPVSEIEDEHEMHVGVGA